MCEAIEEMEKESIRWDKNSY